MAEPVGEIVVGITHLRDTLGIAYQHVANYDEPIIVQRYSRKDVVMVPLWEWKFFKQLEADIRAGRRPWEEAHESGQKIAGQPGELVEVDDD